MGALITIAIILIVALIAQLMHVITIVGVGKIILMVLCLVAFYQMCKTKNEFVAKYRDALLFLCALVYFKIAMLP